MPANQELLIRRYTAADHTAVWDLHNQGLNHAGVHLGPGPWDDDMSAIEAVYLDGNGDFLVGLVSDQIVAMGALKKTGDRRGELKRMRVSPDFQRRGYGQAILEALERRAIELGFKTLHLDTSVKQVAAQGLYERNGFRELSREATATFDAILYEKQLDG